MAQKIEYLSRTEFLAGIRYQGVRRFLSFSCKLDEVLQGIPAPWTDALDDENCFSDEYFDAMTYRWYAMTTVGPINISVVSTDRHGHFLNSRHYCHVSLFPVANRPYPSYCELMDYFEGAIPGVDSQDLWGAGEMAEVIDAGWGVFRVSPLGSTRVVYASPESAEVLALGERLAQAGKGNEPYVRQLDFRGNWEVWELRDDQTLLKHRSSCRDAAFHVGLCYSSTQPHHYTVGPASGREEDFAQLLKGKVLYDPRFGIAEK